MPVCRVLLAKRREETSQTYFERQRRRRQERLFDMHAFRIRKPEEHIASKSRVDGSLQREFYLANTKSRAVFLRGTIWRQIGDQVADQTDVRQQARIGGALWSAGALRNRCGTGKTRNPRREEGGGSLLCAEREWRASQRHQRRQQ